MRTRSRSTPGWRLSSASSRAAGPTSVTPRSKCRDAASAPSTTWPGASSPPIASTAIRIMSGIGCLVPGARPRGPAAPATGLSRRPGGPLLLVDRASLAAAVVAAVRAHAMRRLRLVAVRALAEPDRLQRVVRAALGRPRLRVSSFWIRHRCLALLGRPFCNAFSAASRGSSQCVRAVAGALVPVGPADRAQPLAVVAGRAASSAARGRTARASAGRDRSCRSRRTPSSNRLLRSRARLRRCCGRAADSADRTTRRPASVNGSRHRLHGSSSVVCTRPTRRNWSLSLKMSNASVTGAATRKASSAAGQLFGRVDLLEPLLRVPDLREIQRKHEPPNIPCSTARSSHGPVRADGLKTFAPSKYRLSRPLSETVENMAVAA